MNKIEKKIYHIRTQKFWMFSLGTFNLGLSVYNLHFLPMALLIILIALYIEQGIENELESKAGIKT